MTQLVKVKTGSKFEQLGSYSRLVCAGGWIFVSNTAGRNPQTQLLADDALEQVTQVFSNIETALSSVDASLADVVMSRVFIQDPADTNNVMAFIGEKFRGIEPATTVTCPPLGSTEYKVEIEVTAYQGAANATVEKIDLTQ